MPHELPDYDELQIRLSPGPHGAYNVLISAVSGARGNGTFILPFTDDELEIFRLKVDPSRALARGHRSPHLERTRQFGDALFQALVRDASVRDVFTTARRDAETANRGLRLTLTLTAAPELAGVPWEFLYRRPGFLAQSVNTPLVRYLDLEHTRAPLSLTAPLRILGMISSPRHEDLADLDVEAEREKVQRALAPLIAGGQVDLQWLADGTLRGLQREVDHGSDYHVFHFIGHGLYDESTGGGFLVLERPDGRAHYVTGEQLGGMLCDRHTLRLAVLNACEAATTASRDPFAGVAAALVEYEVPAVVGMQFAITDAAAITFAEELYTALTNRYPIDAAVTLARRALSAENDVEWATPVLFMRVSNGCLFDLRTPPPDDELPDTEVQSQESTRREGAGPAHKRAQDDGASAGAWQPAADRPDPVKILLDQDRGRVAELLALRYGRMLVSPYSFYRGAAAIMASDLAAMPNSGLRVQLCGDAHISNFGTFASPERELVFDIAEFDETLPGPWEWDVKRLAASVWVAGRERGFRRKEIAGAVRQTVAAYHEAMNTFAQQGDLDVWYARLDVAQVARLFATGVDVKAMKTLERRLETARSNTSVKALGKLTATVDGKVGLLHKPPLLVPAEELLSDEHRADAETNLKDLLGGYRETLPENRRTLFDSYSYVNMARRVVGIGSVGMRCWVVLMQGRGGDPLLLQVKEATTSVLEKHLDPPPNAGHAERVVGGQKLMEAVTDIFLGWQSARGPDDGKRGRKRDYYVRQAADGKGAIDISLLLPAGLVAYGRLCGWTLARAHARTADRVAIAGYLGRGDVFERAVAAFAERYADQNEADYKTLQNAVSSGRVHAEIAG